LAKAFLHKAAKKMKKWAYNKRRPAEFRVGDQALVKLYPDRTGIVKGKHRAVIRKYEGPFTVVKRIGKPAYKLDLPPDFKIQSVFHVRNLKPFYADHEDPERSQPQREPILQRAPSTRRTLDRRVDQILQHQVNYFGEPKLYLVKWIDEEHPTWEYAFRLKQGHPAEVRIYYETA
ncbi:hypothetical protein QML37_31180, partial [Klebsiella pneumoniae]|uniref:hypothetical protein n=1 Tax=Klebsiella pneumoniae TaxID=573 RepID=UPI003A8013EC